MPEVLRLRLQFLPLDALLPLAARNDSAARSAAVRALAMPLRCSDILEARVVGFPTFCGWHWDCM
jgi:hypothetical protein